MELTKSRIISPLKIFGGKFFLCRKIIPLMEYRPVWVEGFAATCVTTLNIQDKFRERYCFDLNPNIINFWQVLQADIHTGALHSFLRNTEYSQENFETAKEYLHTHNDITSPFYHAAMYFVCNRMSRSADMRSYGWSDRLRRSKPEYISAYETAVDSLPHISELIQDVVFDCGDFILLSIKHNLGDNEDVLFYLDPPYVHDTRVSQSAYGPYEMKTFCREADGLETTHECLLDYILHGVSGITYLSGYDNPLYDRKIGDKVCAQWAIANSASQSKIKPVKTEILYKIN